MNAAIDFIPESSAQNQFKIDFVPEDQQQPTFLNTIPSPTGSVLRELFNIVPGALRTDKNAIKDRIVATGRGFVDIGEGLKQALLATKEKLGLSPVGTEDDYTKSIDQERNFYNQTRAGKDKYADLFRSGVNSLPYSALALIPGADLGLLAKIGSGAVGTGAINSLQYVPEGESRLANTTQGAVIGGTLPLIPEIPGLLNELRPTSLIGRFASSPLSKSELERNLEATAGTKTGLGDVIGSPTFKRLQENILTKIPFTGANKSLQETGNAILGRGNQLVEDFRNNVDPSEISEKLGKSLIDAKNFHTEQKNSLYAIPNSIADQLNLPLTLPKFSGLANKYIDALESTNILKLEPDVKSLINRLRNYQSPTQDIESKILNTEGKPIVTSTKYPSLQEANILAGKLGDLAEGFSKSTTQADRSAAGIFSQLNKALKSDIRNTVIKSGNKDLIDSFFKAEKNYEQNFSPFLDKDIHQFTNGTKNPEDLIASFLKSSNTSDKANQLNKLMSRLSPSEQDMVRYSYFSRALEGAEDNRIVNPNKLKTLWLKLGENQKKVLVPDASKRRDFDNFVNLVGKNQKAVNMMWNPQTGQMNMDLVTAISLQNPTMAIKEAILGRGLNNVLTSEKSREEIVKRLIERKGG